MQNYTEIYHPFFFYQVDKVYHNVRENEVYLRAKKDVFYTLSYRHDKTSEYKKKILDVNKENIPCVEESLLTQEEIKIFEQAIEQQREEYQNLTERFETLLFQPSAVRRGKIPNKQANFLEQDMQRVVLSQYAITTAAAEKPILAATRIWGTAIFLYDEKNKVAVLANLSDYRDLRDFSQLIKPLDTKSTKVYLYAISSSHFKSWYTWSSLVKFLDKHKITIQNAVVFDFHEICKQPHSLAIDARTGELYSQVPYQCVSTEYVIGCIEKNNASLMQVYDGRKHPLVVASAKEKNCDDHSESSGQNYPSMSHH